MKTIRINPGQTWQLQASFNNIRGESSTVTSKVEWSSSNAAAVSVNSTGLASANTPIGLITYITANYGGGAPTGTIAINPQYRDSIRTVDQYGNLVTDIYLAPDETYQLYSLLTFQDGGTQIVSSGNAYWFTYDANVVTVDSTTGIVTAISGGVSFIGGASQGVQYTITVNIISPLLSIDITPTSSIVDTVTQVEYTAIGTYYKWSPQNITNTVSWVSSNESVATIDSFGTLTPVTTGTTNVFAELSGITSNFAVYENVASPPAPPAAPAPPENFRQTL